MGRIYNRVVVFQAFIIFHLCAIIFLILHKMEDDRMVNNAEVYVYIIVAAVSFLITAVSLIVMIVNDIRYHRQDTYRFDALDKGNDHLNARHDRSSTEHDRLSSEHDKLERNLSEKLHDIDERQNVLKDKIFAYISKEDGRKESMASILPQQDVLSQIQLLYDKILALSDENSKLKYQNQQLQKKLSYLYNVVSEKNKEMNETEQMRDDFMEMDDMNIFDGPDDELEL